VSDRASLDMVEKLKGVPEIRIVATNLLNRQIMFPVSESRNEKITSVIVSKPSVLKVCEVKLWWVEVSSRIASSA